MRVESKGLSLTLHYRGHPDLESQVRELAERQAARSGLSVRTARMSYELHPPIDADKGTALRDVTAGLEAVCFLGDDRGDLPAFVELERLAARQASESEIQAPQLGQRMVFVEDRGADAVLGTEVAHEDGHDQGVGFVARHLHETGSAEPRAHFLLEVPEVLHLEQTA